MTANPHSINLSALVAEQLERAEPDLLRSILHSFIQGVDVGGGRCCVRRSVWCPLRGADTFP